jgi:hypothetical protein
MCLRMFASINPSMAALSPKLQKKQPLLKARHCAKLRLSVVFPTNLYVYMSTKSYTFISYYLQDHKVLTSKLKNK